MNYRLIRFSADGSVELDADVESPNARGCNVFWHTHNPGVYAYLYDRNVNRWYKLNTTGERLHATWLDNGANELPQYINMMQLVGAM